MKLAAWTFIPMLSIGAGALPADAADGCAPGTNCLSVTSNGEPAPGPGPFTAQCSGRFPDFVVRANTLEDFAGPWFALSQDYPQDAPVDDAPWLAIDFADGIAGADAYLYALRDYAFEGMIENDFDPHKNTVRKWYHMPLMNFGPNPREFMHGLTPERPVRAPELGLKPGVQIRNYAIGFYNAAGGATIGEVWALGTPDLTKARFSEGTMTFKILFTDAKPENFLDPAAYPLTGAPEWTIATSGGTTTVRLMQMDVAAADADAPTGWVFGTFAFDKNATDASPWKRLRAVGLAWGNDFGVTPTDVAAGTKLGESTISDEAPAYALAHLGWAGRANGPVDNPKSACLSCHTTAQFPVEAELGPFAASCDTDAKKMQWFRNLTATQAFGAVDEDTCEPTTPDTTPISLDFSLQMSVAVQSVLQYGDVNPCEPMIEALDARFRVPFPYDNAPRIAR